MVCRRIFLEQILEWGFAFGRRLISVRQIIAGGIFYLPRIRSAANRSTKESIASNILMAHYRLDLSLIHRSQKFANSAISVLPIRDAEVQIDRNIT